jgi:hypothetical protein
MKKIFSQTVMFALFGGIILSGCKKDSNENNFGGNCELTLENLAGTYKVTAAVYKASANAQWEDEYATWDDCEKDDTYTFTTGSQMTMTDAGQQCNPPGGETHSFFLDGNEIQIGGQETYEFRQFGCNGFQVSQKGLTGGAEYLITFMRS